jgi:hypothetical protein
MVFTKRAAHKGGEKGELTLSRFSDILEPHLIEGVGNVDYLPEMPF